MKSKIRCKSILYKVIVLVFFTIRMSAVFAATFNFNTLYKGTGTTYITNSQNITGLVSISASSIQFYQAGAQFSGNSVSGVLTYYNASNQLVTIYGNVNRQSKSGSSTEGFYFTVYTDATYTTSTGDAYLFVVPGQESAFSVGGTAPTSSDPVDKALNGVVNSMPAITVSGTLGAFTACGTNTPSSVQTLTVSAVNLTANMTVTAPVGFEVSALGLTFTSSITIPHSSGSISSRTVYFRLSGSASSGTNSGEVTFTSTNAGTIKMLVNGSNILPTITLGTVTNITTSNTSFSLPYTATTGSPNQYSISTGTPSAMAGFSAVSNATLGSSPISVAVPTSAANTYNFNISVKNITTGCISSATPFTVQVLTMPTIIITGSLSAFTSCAGTASAEQSFTIGGSNLTADINIAAPTGFELSTTSGSGFSSAVIITQVGGSISSTTVYARLSAAATGTPSGNITCTSTGATTQNISVSGTLNAATSITTHPVNKTVAATNNITFSVSASGVSLSYQWQVSANNGVTFTPVSNVGGIYSGATSATLTLTGVDASYNSYQYKCEVTGTCSIATSSAATLTVVSASSPNILTSGGTLTPFTACIGAVSAEQSFTVGGSNLTAAIDIAAPTGYEIREVGGTYSGAVSLALSSGTVTTTTIYIRLKSNAIDGASGNIACTSTGAAQQDIATGSATVNALPTITLGSVTNIYTSATSASLPYTATTGNPNQYSITTGTPTAMASFSAVTGATLASSPISIAVPASSANTYHFNITLNNTTTGCVSSATPFTVQVVKDNSTIVVTGPTSFNYTGSAQGPSSNTKTGSTGAVTYSYSGVSPTVYAASATAPIAVGTYEVIATLAADADYNGASSVAYAFEIVKANSTIVVTGPTSFNYTASAQGPSTNTNTGSTGSVTYSYSGVSPTVYVASATAPTAVGTYQVIATLASDANYNGASSVAFAFEIVKANSTIVVTGLTSFNYNASAQGPSSNTKTGSTGAVTYSYSGVSPTVYAASATAPTAVGDYAVIATLAADADYNGAISSAYAFVIINNISTIVVTGSTSFTYNGSAQGPSTNTKTGSTGAVTYSYSGVSPTVYTASATAPTAVGTYQVIATLASDANYPVATSVAYAFEIIPAPSTIVVTGATGFSYNRNSQGPSTSTISGSTGAVTYAYQGTGATAYGPSSVAPTDAGNYEVVATLAADANFNAASSAAYAFTIQKINPVVVLADMVKLMGDPSFAITATSNSNGAITYSSGSAAIATITVNTVSLMGLGITTITVTQAESVNYNAGGTTATLTVTPAAPITNNGTYVSGSSGNPFNTNLLITPMPGATINFYPAATGGSPSNTQTLPSQVGVYTFYVSQTISGIEGPRVAYVVTILPEIKTKNATYVIGGSINPATISSLVSSITSGSKPQWCDVAGNNCSATAPALPTTAGVTIWCVKAVDTISGLVSSPCIYDTVTMLTPASVMGITKLASKPVVNPDGTFTLQYKFTVSNLSSELLDSVQIVDDLRTVFVSPMTYEIVSLKAGANLSANSSYNGSSQINLLGYPSKLAGLQSDTVILVVKISPKGYAGSINNTALISGVAPLSGRVGPVLSNDPTNYNNSGSSKPTHTILPLLNIIIPSGFSPNNDGVNDNFAIIHPYNTSISLQVFNRWGNIVFKNGNYNNEWYGKGVGNFLGQDVPAGTYYYVVNATDKSNNQVSNFVGYLTLKR